MGIRAGEPSVGLSSQPRQVLVLPFLLPCSHSEWRGSVSPSFKEALWYNSKKPSLEHLSEPMWKVSGVSLCVAVPAWGLHVLPPWANAFNSLALIGETWKNAWFLLPFLLHLLLCLPLFQSLPAWSPWGEAVVAWTMQSEYTFFLFGWTLSFFAHGHWQQFLLQHSLFESIRPSVLYLFWL